MDTQSIRVGEVFAADVAVEAVLLVVRSNMNIEIGLVDENFRATFVMTGELL